MKDPVISPWTRIAVGLEEGPSGFTHAHALTIPGCSATGTDTDDALRSFQMILPEWLELLAAIGETIPPPSTEIEIAVDEWIATDAAVSGGESDVLFEADRVPLTDPGIRLGLSLLGSLRGRLLTHVRRASNEELARAMADGPDARLVLDELARAQWWTLTRLGASPLALVPERVVARLDTAMALVVERFTTLPANARNREIELEGELWTPRKVLRRLIWLEWNLGSTAIRAIEAGTAA
jgi:predicted RNase H-like HicB family nuclease